MEAKLLAKILSSHPETKNIFRGIFTPDQLSMPGIVQGGNKNLVIVMAKKHYLLIFIGEDKNFFLDSLNKNPRNYSDLIYDFLIQYGDYELAPFRVQSSQSKVCGYYVILWSILLGKMDVTDVNMLFEYFQIHEPIDNDKLVLKYVQLLTK